MKIALKWWLVFLAVSFVVPIVFVPRQKRDPSSNSLQPGACALQLHATGRRVGNHPHRSHEDGGCLHTDL